jgi:hypothetical protein
MASRMGNKIKKREQLIAKKYLDANKEIMHQR